MCNDTEIKHRKGETIITTTNRIRVLTAIQPMLAGLDTSMNRTENISRSRASVGRIPKHRRSKDGQNMRCRIGGRQNERSYRDSIPRQGVLIDETLDHLAMQQGTNGIFYIIELTAPNGAAGDVSMLRYGEEEPQTGTGGNMTGNQHNCYS
ncbi:uncharacterized protein Ecym_5190 [Eremothecium cymbalariae DBVPG|uniref:Uncharacterized protein n=1 Tax=Eremothecium cymbalariae (strain CBS 270.75 / DBVPG 7215 / KCTC 17166 / NRRL Y-17582) TaxID=931890 RepID=I6ND20_ERECY|nr:hypothetical protein Ecym_5190 [Eremothecium cymbalariae DBVPG\